MSLLQPLTVMPALFTLHFVSAQEAVTSGEAQNLKWAADHTRLLPGEHPQSLFSDDAQHWIRVYSDLLSFNKEMLAGIRSRYSLSASADGPERADVDLLRAHIRRLRWRLRFWERRRAQLSPSAQSTL